MQHIRELEDQVIELESSHNQAGLEIAHEAQALLALRCNIFHGPDTVERLSSFSMEAVHGELESTAPTMLKLFQQVGDTARGQSSCQAGSFSLEEMKMVSSYAHY